MDVLGATGSVGTQALDVAKRLGIGVRAISCGANTERAEEIIREFKIKMCAVADEQKGKLLRAAVADTGCKIYTGRSAASDVAIESDADITVNAITGIAGLMPTLKVLESGKELALANKESLVTAGQYVMSLAAKNKREIRPVDSEHCAVWQSLRAGKKEEIKKIILTASGGPFFGYTKEQLAGVTAEQALKHPTWKMGAKITIDSATLMNKGLELIEAVWLFGVKPEDVQIVVHRQSIIHSAVQYADNSVIAQLGSPDMRLPIQYAITYPERYDCPAPALDFYAMKDLTFDRPDPDTFLCLKAAMEAIEKGGLYPCAVNGANERAVQLFLEDKIGFADIGRVVYKTLSHFNFQGEYTLKEVYETDKKARAFVDEQLLK